MGEDAWEIPTEVDEATIERLALDPLPWEFFRYLSIEHDKTKAYVPFDNLYDEQTDWIKALLTNHEAIDLKDRNIGIGVATQAFHFWRAWKAAFAHGIGLNTLVVAHSEDTAKRHIDRYKDFNSRLPDGLRLDVPRVAGGENATEYKLIVPGKDKDYVWFRAVTAGGKKGGGRGFTFSQLHCTEYAFWENDHYQSLTSTMHESEWRSVAIESTPDPEETNKSFRPMYYTAKGNRDGSGLMVARFYGWHHHRSFRIPVPQGWERNEHEERLARQYGLTDEQLAWRRQKTGGAGPDSQQVRAFKKEYPIVEDEAFEAAIKDAFFNRDKLEILLHHWRDHDNIPRDGFKEFSPPQLGQLYAVHLDPSKGVGKDYAAIQVINHRLEQCLVWQDNYTNVHRAAELAVRIAISYNNATLGVDAVGPGAGAALRIHELGYPVREFREDGNKKKGGRRDIMAYAGLQIEQERVTIHDYWTIRDLMEMNLIDKPRHNDMVGHHDAGTAWVYCLWLARSLRSVEANRFANVQQQFMKATNLIDPYRVLR